MIVASAGSATMPPIEIVVTSGSGDGRALVRARRMRSMLAARGDQAHVRCFRNADDLHRWAQCCSLRSSHLVCVGGNTTLSAAAIASTRLAVPLVPVPRGFGNVFAHALGYGDRTDAIVDLVQRGDVRRVDVGLAGREIFLSHRSYGFLDAV
jgi:diacylglycerol kinase family enzyme